MRLVLLLLLEGPTFNRRRQHHHRETEDEKVDGDECVVTRKLTLSPHKDHQCESFRKGPWSKEDERIPRRDLLEMASIFWNPQVVDSDIFCAETSVTHLPTHNFAMSSRKT